MNGHGYVTLPSRPVDAVLGDLGCVNWCCAVDGPQRHPLLGTRTLVVVPLDGQASWVYPCVETLPAFSWCLC